MNEKFLEAAKKAGVDIVPDNGIDGYNVIYDDGRCDFIDPTFDTENFRYSDIEIKNDTLEKKTKNQIEYQYMDTNNKLNFSIENNDNSVSLKETKNLIKAA